MSSSKRVADVIAERLGRETKWSFGVPGGEVLSLIDALDKAGVRFVLARHETSAGFMAEGAQRVGGGVGVLVATVGPGVANTINVVSHAQQARRPLIVLTGCVSNQDAYSYTHQVFDHQQVLRPLCKASFRIAPQTAAETIERALQLAQSGAPGPVHVDVPVDIADALVTSPGSRSWKLAATSATGAQLEHARRALRDAKRPLVIAGLEMLGDSQGRIREHFQRAAFPLITTYEAKGLVDEHHPAVLGGAGLSPKADAILLPLVRQADVILLAGYDPVEVRHSWRHPFAEDAIVIELTRQTGHHGMHFPTHTFVGDPGVLLHDLLKDVVLAPWPDGSPQKARHALVDAFAPRPAWGPDSIFDAMSSVLDDDTVLAVDTGAHRLLLCQQWRFRKPGRILQSNGTSTMACAIPMAIGAKLAKPDTPVAAVVGDGGLEMALGELGTLRDMRLPIPIVVLDDRSLALIEKKQRSRGLKNVGVDFGSDESFQGTDYAAIAQAFGGCGVRVDSRPTLEKALEESLLRDTFTLIHCPISRGAYDDRI